MTRDAAIHPHHRETAYNIVRILAEAMPLCEVQYVLLACLEVLAAQCSKPHEAYENFLGALAQLNGGERGPIAKAVLDVVAEYMAGERT